MLMPDDGDAPMRVARNYSPATSDAIPVNNDSCLPVYRLMFRHFEGGSSDFRPWIIHGLSLILSLSFPLFFSLFSRNIQSYHGCLGSALNRRESTP